MDCLDIVERMTDHLERRLCPSGSARIDAHLSSCRDCRAARAALRALRVERDRPVPCPDEAFLTRAVRHAAARSPAHLLANAGRSRFWLGTWFGAALAAGLGAVMMGAGMLSLPPQTSVMPTAELAIALHDSREVNIAIDSPISVANADIRVVVSGAIALTDFADQTELRWSTPLDPGTNLLSVPVTMQGSDGGHLLVEVVHGSERKTFAVRVTEGEPARPMPRKAQGRMI